MNIDITLASKLVATQFPQWADLPITPVEFDGWDNRTFRLGKNMSLRLPSAEAYVGQVEKEHRWLPVLAPHLPLPIPTPLAMGMPGADYPWQWSIYSWLEGEIATRERVSNLPEFATTLAQFLIALQSIDPDNGPPAGQHNFYRGGPLANYDAETRQAIITVQERIDTSAVTHVWEAALNTVWHGSPVWIHGDVSAANLLINQGQLKAVIDFGCSATGDPACDTTIAWTLFFGYSREAFKTELRVDDATWLRGKGWALWKALITLAENMKPNSAKGKTAQSIIVEILADH